MIKKITLLFILFSFIFICSQHQKLSYLPEEIFGKQPKPSAYKKFKINDEKNKFSTYYINNYKKLPIKRVPEEKIKSQAKDLIVDVQQSLNYLNQNFKNDSVIFDQNLGNKIAEIKNIDKNDPKGENNLRATIEQIEKLIKEETIKTTSLSISKILFIKSAII